MTLTRHSRKRPRSAAVPGVASQLAVLAGGEAVASAIAGPGPDAFAAHGGTIEVVPLEVDAASAAGAVQASSWYCQGKTKTKKKEGTLGISITEDFDLYW